jgi:hypothetical protein
MCEKVTQNRNAKEIQESKTNRMSFQKPTNVVSGGQGVLPKSSALDPVYNRKRFWIQHKQPVVRHKLLCRDLYGLDFDPEASIITLVLVIALDLLLNPQNGILVSYSRTQLRCP